MQRGMSWLPGRVVAGHGVASGRSATTPYPGGTIALQRPFFLERGIDQSVFYPGTLNVDVAPHTPVPGGDAVVFDGKLKWFGDIEERFIVARIGLRFRGVEHDGVWYYPHPETKPAHFQKPTVVELLMPWIDGLGEGAAVEVSLALP